MSSVVTRSVAVCKVDDVPPDDVRSFQVEGLPAVAVFNIEGRFYVTDDCCTHEKASLAEGTLDGDVIECPFHGGSFNVVTGDVVSRPPRKPLCTYDVRVEADVVCLLIPAD